MIETDLNNNSISRESDEKAGGNEFKSLKSDSINRSKCLIDQHVDEQLCDLLSTSKTNSIMDNTPNSTTVAANLLGGTSLVTAIEAVTVTSMSNSLTNMDHSSPNQSSILDDSTLIESSGNVDGLDFDDENNLTDNSLTDVTQCFNIKTEPDEQLLNDNLLNETGKSLSSFVISK